MLKKRFLMLFILTIFITLTSCGNQQPDEMTSSVPESSFETETGSEMLDVQAIYDEAVRLKESGDNLHAMQLFMSIYQYQDAWEQYDSLLMNTRISVDADCIGLLTDNGTVTAIGDGANRTGVKESWSAWSGIRAISSHAYGLIGLTDKGTVVSTPDTKNTKWYAGAEVVNDWEGIVKITCGTYHTLGLKSDGSVIATRYVGDIEYNKGQCNVSDWDNIISIAAGSTHSMGLKADGTVLACGDNSKNQCDVEDWRDVVQISANADYSVGLKSDGTVLITGKSYFGESLNTSALSSWSDIVSVSVGPYHIVGLKADGTVVAVGSNNNGECDVETWKDMRCVVAGSSITVGVAADGTVIFVGNESSRCTEVNGYNLFTGEKGAPIEPELSLPQNFPTEIPLYENQKILKVSETNEATVVAFETKASFDDAFAYYEKWCQERGGYIKQPFEGGLDMLITPMHDLKKSISIIVTKGVTYEDGTQSNNCAVIVMLQGGDSYENVSTLK